MSWPPRFRPTRSLLAVLAMLCGIPGLLCFALALSAFGDRHGADLLFAGIGAPSLLLSLAFGFAWKWTPPATPLRNRGARIPAGGWMLAAAAVAIATAAAYVALVTRAGGGEGRGALPVQAKAGAKAEDPAKTVVVVPEPVVDTLDRLRARQSAAATLFDLEPRSFSDSRRERVLGDTLAPSPQGVWTANVHAGRRYFLPGTFGDGFSGSPLGCRSVLLRRFVVDWFRSAVIRRTPSGNREYAFSRPLAGDTLLAEAGCKEIPFAARFYLLDTLPGGKTAAWKPFEPWYTLAVDPVPQDCEDGIQLALRLHPPGGEGRDHDLIMATQDSVSAVPFPYRPLAGASIADPDMKSVQPPEVDLTGFDSTRYRRFWIKNSIESIGKEEKVRDAVTEAVLYCETVSGKTLRLGASVYPGPSYLPDAWMGAGLLADFDGDGSSDILVWGEYVDTRILFLDGEGIRDSIIVSPNQSSEGCC